MGHQFDSIDENIFFCLPKPESSEGPGMNQEPPMEQVQARDFCRNRSKPATFTEGCGSVLHRSRNKGATSTRAGLSQRPQPEQSQSKDLNGRSPKKATFIGAGQNDIWDSRVTLGKSEQPPQIPSDLHMTGNMTLNIPVGTMI